MARKNKYKKGALFPSLISLVDWIMNGRWAYWGDVPKSPKVLINMSLSTLLMGVRHGYILPAIENEEEK